MRLLLVLVLLMLLHTGTLFEEQLSKRNTYMLYVLDSAGEVRQDG